MARSIEIAGRGIGDDCPVYVIAEIGINHDGDMETAARLLHAAADAGADAVKLQSYLTERRVPADSPIFGILKKCELTFDQQRELFDLGRELELSVFSTPFDNDSVDFLESVECPAYKVASFDSVNLALLRRIAATGKPVIMSTGMTTVEELGAAWRALGGKEDGTGCDLALLHCISAYPTEPEDARLAMIPYLKSIHGGPVGYSDHTIGVEVPSLAIAAGAQLIEKHFTLDTKAEGPDHALSADPGTLREMVDFIRRIERILGTVKLGIRTAEEAIVPYRRASA